MSIRTIAALSLLIASGALYAQADAPAAPQTSEPAAAAAEAPAAPLVGVPYRIADVDYDIRGITREYPLTQAVDVDRRRVFPNKESLDRYLTDLEIKFLNQRVFQSASITSEFGNAGDDGVVPVRLTVHTVDTWNIIALPYPKFDSNSGLTMKLKLKDFNFMGSMQVLTADVNYQYDENEKSSFEANLDFSIPFKAFGYEFVWDIDATGGIPLGEVPELNMSTGIDVALPMRFADLHVGLRQGIALNDRDDEDILYSDDRRYFTDEVYANLPITLHSFDYLGALTWTPSVSVTSNWDPSGITNDDLKGPDLTVGHSLGIGRVDWVSNFRHGVSLSLSNNYGYDLHSDGDVSVSVSAQAQGYACFFDRFGITSQAYGFYNFNGDLSESGGSKMRGILNDRLDTDTAVTLNIDLPVRVMRVNFLEITGVSWTRYIGFEMHANPFIDVALSHDQAKDTWFTFEDGWYSGGMEIIVYPMKMRSIYGRFSAGCDLVELARNGGKLSGRAERDDESIRELFIGIGLHY